jgi:branched-chain amino acid transport system ATP-binding protein
MSLLSCHNVVAGYGDLVAVDGLSLELGDGELVGVVGPNGAGKSSLLRAITGVIPVRSGRVVWKGEDIGSLAPEVRARKGISMVQEGRRLWPTLSVKDNLMMGAYRAKKQDRAERQDEVVTLFPALGRILNRSASVLSGGEQQMVAVGRALMSRPACLLIDEPSLGLAPIVVDEIYKTLPELQKRGMSILLIEQEVRRVLDVADRVLVLHEGKIVHSGPAQEFKDNPGALAEIYLGGNDSTKEAS